jgi:phenylacetate-coenzyme A ligase PaaK-like adenylate-forming protein
MSTATDRDRPHHDELRARHLEDLLAAVPGHIERLTWSADEIVAHQRGRLRAVLGHAQEHAPWYARRLAGLDLDAVTPSDLSSLPILTKRDLMASFDDIVTDRRLTRDRVEGHLAATGTSPRYLDDEYLCLASGGSSGVRGVFVYGWSAAVDFLLGMARVPIAKVNALGGPPPGGVPVALVAAGSAVHATRGLSRTFAGGIVDPITVPATLPLAEIVRRLNDLRPPLLHGYPSVLHRLALEQIAGRLQLSVLGVTSTSEQLSEGTRELITQAFGVHPTDQFGSTEGLVGVSDDGEVAISLADDLAIVELVDAAGRPVPDGVPSDRVLVTTLFNPVLPLIRYELSDRMVRQPASPHHGHMRVLVEGRADAPLRFAEVEVHPLAVRSVLVQVAEIVEFQVRQRARGIDVDVVTCGPVDVEAVGDHLRAALAGAGLPAPEVAVREVAELARHAETGKVRRFVPLG